MSGPTLSDLAPSARFAVREAVCLSRVCQLLLEDHLGGDGAAATKRPGNNRTAAAMMLAPAALAIAGALAVATWRQRQRRRLAKPQRRFRLHLTDNSEAPFVHWSRQQAGATPCSHTTSRRAAGTAVAQQDAASQQQLEQHGQAQGLHQHQHQQLAQQQHPFHDVIHGLIQRHMADTAPPVLGSLALPPLLEQTPLHLVRTPAQLRRMAQQLKTVGNSCTGGRAWEQVRPRTAPFLKFLYGRSFCYLSFVLAVQQLWRLDDLPMAVMCDL